MEQSYDHQNAQLFYLIFPSGWPSGYGVCLTVPHGAQKIAGSIPASDICFCIFASLHIYSYVLELEVEVVS